MGPQSPPPLRARHLMWPARRVLIAIGIAWALVLFRNVVFIAYEQSFFDSDQAIVGLMAKHLSEGRAFPLYYYGQTYMLGVDAFVAAPVFLIAGPTVGALHASLTLVNLLVVTLVIIGLTRGTSLSPWLAVLASVFFTLAPPVTAKSLVEAGANIGPFVYVPLLWFLRRRPIWWGMVMAVGFLHREFTIYAVPVLLAAELLQGRGHVTRAVVERWIVAAVVALACWQCVQALAPYADFMGPGTRGDLMGGFTGSQGGNIADRMSLVPAAYPERVRVMMGEALPRLYGLRYVKDVVATQGRDWLVLPMWVALLSVTARLGWLTWEGRTHSSNASFAWYLAGVGALAVAAYVATRPAGGLVDRYLLLTLMLPIGVFAAFFTLERASWARRAVAGLLVVWAVSAGSDHLQLIRRYANVVEPDDIRVLADGLEARGIHVAEADYWRAYKLTFLTQERVVVASTDFVRIEAYQQRARAVGDALVRISEVPCAGGRPVSLWHLCPAGR